VLDTQNAEFVDMPMPDYPMPRTDPLLPPPAYDELRRHPPQQVRLPDGRIAWMLTRYQDVRDALSDARLSSDFLQPNFPTVIQLPPAPGAFSFFRMDPPDHSRLRRMVAPEFTPRRVRALRPAITALTDTLLDRMLATGPPADLVTHFALPLPSLVIAAILGIPSEHNTEFHQYSETIASSAVTPAQAFEAFGALTAMLDAVATAKQAHPSDDLISRLVTDHESTGDLTRAELVAMAAVLLVAGHETTAQQIAMSVVHLLHNPEQLQVVRQDPQALPAALDELLRICAVFQHDLVRVASEDLHIGGVRIAKGQGVITSQLAANHDPQTFPDPGSLDLSRDAHQHLALGHGPHTCIGATLAKTELEIALHRLLTRLPHLALATSLDHIPFRDDIMIYGVHRLPITW
jgi:cytochrome P450